MPSDDYRHRMTVELTEDQAIILNRILPHGMKKRLFQALVDGVIEAYQNGGYEAISAISSGYISVQQLGDLSIQHLKKVTKE